VYELVAVPRFHQKKAEKEKERGDGSDGGVHEVHHEVQYDLSKCFSMPEGRRVLERAEEPPRATPFFLSEVGTKTASEKNQEKRINAKKLCRLKHERGSQYNLDEIA